MSATITPVSVPATESNRRTGDDPLAISAELKSALRILIVDDDRTLREGCANVLRVEGFNVTAVGRGDEAITAVGHRTFDIILCDLYLTPVTGMDVLHAALRAKRSTLVIMMTGDPSVTSSVEALRAGAWDYLVKPFAAQQLLLLIGRAAHTISLAREAEDSHIEFKSQSSNGERITLLGSSPAFRNAIQLARRVAPTDASVMITGESGTGKEMIAQYIHAHSRRAKKNLLPINCAALPEPLLESEMFGHRKGSFTGADREKQGLLEAAHSGTLFLDELTEMSQALQAKLLRVLQDGAVRRVGSEQVDAVVDVRFISATNREPQDAVNAGILRADLFYRLRVVQIKLPPLRNRTEDIPPLANYFLRMYWEHHRPMGSPPPRLTESAIEVLRSHYWRGNVRELQNVIESLAVFAEPRQEIKAEDIPFFDDSAGPVGAPATIPASVMEGGYHAAKDRVVEHFEKEYLARLVLRSGGNMSRAARVASIDRTTLYRLMEKHSLERERVSLTSTRSLDPSTAESTMS
jgi:two-component system response regulator PilR (NtrC family)